MATELVMLQGSAHAPHKELLRGKKKIEDAFGDEIVLVIRGKIQEEVKTDSKSAGQKATVKARVSDVLVLDSDESDEYLERIAADRARRYEKETGQQPLPPSSEKGTEANSGHGGDSRDK